MNILCCSARALVQAPKPDRVALPRLDAHEKGLVAGLHGRLIRPDLLGRRRNVPRAPCGHEVLRAGQDAVGARA